MNQTAKQYEKIKIRYFLAETFLSLLVVGVFSLAGPALWFADYLKPCVGDGYFAAWAYTTVCLVGYSLLFLPMDYARGYKIEHRFALSQQKFGAWAADYAKSFALKWVMTSLFAVVLLALLRLSPQTWWIWAGIFWFVFGIALSHLFPVLIMPLFFKITPLENEPLRARILRLAEKTKTKIVGIYQFDMSKKTKKANALFTGLGKTKRIILGDTLLSKFGQEEIEVILAHEMGHCVHRHIARQVIASTALTFLGLWLVRSVLHIFVQSQGLASAGQIGVLPAVGFLLTVLAFAAMPLTNAYSRHCERQADRFALLQTGDKAAFESSMQKLSEQNLANAEPHPAVEFFLYSHPSISKRIRMAREFRAEA